MTTATQAINCLIQVELLALLRRSKQRAYMLLKLVIVPETAVVYCSMFKK